MATFNLHRSIDPSEIDFSDFGSGTITPVSTSEFRITADGPSGSTLNIVVKGSGFGLGNPPTGTVNSIEVDASSFLGTSDVFELSDIAVPLAKIYQAGTTPSVADDLALILSIFKGHDKISGDGPNPTLLSSGDDILAGYDGNDTIDGGAGGDTMNGGKGNDYVSYQSSGSGLTIDFSDPSNNTGDADGDVYNSFWGVIGSKKADDITGSGADEHLNGGGGKDDIVGGGGDDVFEFTSKLSAKKGPTITDFGDGDDKLLLDKAIFTEAKEDAAGVIASSFHIGAKATDEDHRFIYNDQSGKLFYDADGEGGAKQKLVAIFDDDVVLSRQDLELN
jgi:Ca2+-binding RTX toxin-like protein